MSSGRHLSLIRWSFCNIDSIHQSIPADYAGRVGTLWRRGRLCRVGLGRPGCQFGKSWGARYPGNEIIGTCKMSLTFSASVDFISVEISEVLETLSLTSTLQTIFGSSEIGLRPPEVGKYHYGSNERSMATLSR